MKKYICGLVVAIFVGGLNASSATETELSREALLEKLTPYAQLIKNTRFPEGLPRCTDIDIDIFKQKLDIETLPDEFVDFIKRFDHCVFKARTILPLQESFQELQTIPLIRAVWKSSIPKTYLPFCYDNADYYCLDLKDGSVHFWSHDSKKFSDKLTDIWSSFYDWVEKDWLPLMAK